MFADPENEKISKQASYESIVLLKNKDHFLPLKREEIKNILIAGPNADAKDLSLSRYGPKKIEYKSILEAFREKLGDRQLMSSIQRVVILLIPPGPKVR